MTRPCWLRRAARNRHRHAIEQVSLESAVNLMSTQVDDDDEDRFTRAINDTLQAQAGADEYKPVTVDAETLRSLYRAEVFCCKPRQPGLRATYYKSAIPDVHMALSQSCHRFFHEDDFEYAVLKEGRCPYSRAKDVGDFGTV
jgi:intraflagellar transport protein 122